MFIVISPAKKLDFDSPISFKKSTKIKFSQEAYELIKKLRKFSSPEIAKLMKLSDSLAQLNVDRYKKYKNSFNESDCKQAVFAFSGDTYVGLDASSLDKSSIDYAQKHLGILSGLYGLIRPLDLIYPYRLEMGTKLSVEKAKNLYEYWSQMVTKEIGLALKKEKYLINLASNEYFKVVDIDSLEGEVITPVFKEKRGDKYKIISFCAKKARGMMARFIIENKVSVPKELKKFNSGGYTFNKSLSNESEFVFTRQES